MLISFLITNTFFSLNLPFIAAALLVALAHFPLIAMSVWRFSCEVILSSQTGSNQSANPECLRIFGWVIIYSLSSLVVGLQVMSLIYVGLGVFQSYLKGRLFIKTIREYSLVTVVSILLFLLLFPGK